MKSIARVLVVAWVATSAIAILVATGDAVSAVLILVAGLLGVYTGEKAGSWIQRVLRSRRGS